VVMDSRPSVAAVPGPGRVRGSSKKSLPPPRDSPPRGAKSIAFERIHSAVRPSFSRPRSVEDAARTPSCDEAASRTPSDAAFRTPNYAPQPESAAAARAIDLMHTGEESEDDGFGGSPQLPDFRDEGVARRKSTGEYDTEDDAEDDADFNDKDEDDDDDLPPDGEVSTYTFFARLTHYMEGAKITQQNRKAVEIVILVEAGTSV
jgi:hypothetical protein